MMVIITLIVMLLTITACADMNNEQHKNESNMQHKNEPKYSSEKFKVIDHLAFQGEIDDYIHKYPYTALYSDGSFYEKSYDSELNEIWIKWSVGKDKKILNYLDDNNTLVVENKDGTLTAFIRDGASDDGVKEQKIKSIDLQINKDEFVFAQNNFRFIVIVYKRNGIIYQQNYYIENQIISDPIPLLIGIHNYDYSYGVEIIGELSDLYILPNAGRDTFGITQDNVLYSGRVEFARGNENDEPIFYSYPSLSEPRIKNVDFIFQHYANNGYFLSIPNDINNIYYYDNKIDYTSEDNWYNESSKIALPVGYTTKRIKDFIWYDGDVLIRFDDNSIYMGDLYKLNYQKEMTVYNLEKDDFLSSFGDKIIKITETDNYRLGLLMDDGYLYEYR